MRAAKIDENQAEIVAALRREPGVTLTILSMVGNGCPDLVVGVGATNLLIEIKTKYGRLTPAQVEWHQTWQGQKAVVHTVGEALRLVRQIKKGGLDDGKPMSSFDQDGLIDHDQAAIGVATR